MKKFMIIFLMFFNFSIYAQAFEIKPVEVNDTLKIKEEIWKLKRNLKKQFNSKIKSGLEPNNIMLNDISYTINGKNATVLCDLIVSTKKEQKKYKNHKIKFKKDKLWQLSELPSILQEDIVNNNLPSQIIESTSNSLKKSNSEKSIEEVQLVTSQDVFIPFPAVESPLTYEIDRNVTQDELDIKLFSEGTSVDGCVYYNSYYSEYYFDRTIFYLDQNWNRIVFAREVNGEYDDIKAYSGDDNVEFKGLSAIDINENGELFVLDLLKGVYKLQYNASSHSITSSTSSNIVTHQTIPCPSDLSYSNRGTYNNLSDDYFAISDLSNKSIILFGYNGTIIGEFDEYDGIPIVSPKKVEIIEQSNFLTMNFIDGQKVVHAWSYDNSTLSATYSSDFPSDSYLQGLGINSLFGGVDGMIVSDVTKNMLHYLDPLSCEYICSFTGNSTGYFSSPASVFSTAYAHFEHSNSIRLDFFTMDRWSDTRGIKRFVPGADIINTSVSRGEFKYILVFDETNDQYTEIELIDNSTGEIISTNSQYAYDVMLVPNREYKWKIKYKPLQDDMYEGFGNGWKTKEISFVFEPTLPSTITSDYTLSSSYSTDQNVTIEEGATLTIEPGVQLDFNAGSKLSVYGGLDVNGGTLGYDQVWFNFDGGTSSGIFCYAQSDVDIQHATILGGYRGIYANNCDPIIKSCYISATTFGISAYYSAPYIQYCHITSAKYGIYLYKSNTITEDPIILNNTIRDSDYYGIYLYNSYAKIRNNEIYNNQRGVYCYYQSSPHLGEVGYYGNNTIRNNTIGIYAYNNSDPFLGRNTCTVQGGHNKVYDNTSYNAYARYNGSLIQAEDTWWGSNPPNYSKFYFGSGGDIDYYPYLTSSPLSKNSTESSSPEELLYDSTFDKPISQETEKKYHYDKKWPLDWKILYIRNLILVQDYKYAQNLCEEIIDKYPDSTQTFNVLNLYQFASRKYDMDQYVKFLNKKLDDKKLSNLYGIMELMLEDVTDPSIKKIDKYDNIADKYKDDAFEKIILFHKFSYCLNELEDIDKAKTISDELNSKFPETELSIEARIQLGEDLKHNDENIGDGNNSDQMSSEFVLSGNYPNPFNPSTYIKFSLPAISDISLKIYDITGKLIRSYESESQPIGWNEIYWDGNNSHGNSVASGIYLYTIDVKPKDGEHKSIRKSAKLLLIK